MNKRIECVVTGRVQMVMFRDFVTRHAKKLGIVGEVWNALDGTVHVVAEGQEAAITLLVERLKKGPVLAHVENAKVVYLDGSGTYTDFTITNDKK